MASTSPGPKETPSSSTFQSPQPPKEDGAAGSQGSTAGRGRGRPKGSKDGAPRKPRATSKKPPAKSSVATSTPKPRAGAPAAIEEPERTLDPADVEKFLEGIGDFLHPVGAKICGVDPEDEEDLFRFTASERKDLARPISRVIARHKRLAGVVKVSDEILIASVMMKYLGRNAVDVASLRSMYVREGVQELEVTREAGGVPGDGSAGPQP